MESINSIPVFTNNIFDKKVDEITSYAYGFPFGSINTYFTDSQAKNICSKMINKRIRYFSQLFMTDSKNVDKEMLRYQMHYLANQALQFYGGKILSFIHDLKKWSSRKKSVELLSAELDNLDEYGANFPELNVYATEPKKCFTIRFSRVYERPMDNFPVLTIKNHVSSISSQMTREGQLIDNLEGCIPQLLLFKESLDGSFTLYAGYDDDVCDICERPLSDPISIKYGRGPICRRTNGTP